MLELIAPPAGDRVLVADRQAQSAAGSAEIQVAGEDGAVDLVGADAAGPVDIATLELAAAACRSPRLPACHRGPARRAATGQSVAGLGAAPGSHHGGGPRLGTRRARAPAKSLGDAE
jgi:hypothetical protein